VQFLAGARCGYFATFLKFEKKGSKMCRRLKNPETGLVCVREKLSTLGKKGGGYCPNDKKIERARRDSEKTKDSEMHNLSPTTQGFIPAINGCRGTEWL